MFTDQPFPRVPCAGALAKRILQADEPEFIRAAITTQKATGNDFRIYQTGSANAFPTHPKQRAVAFVYCPSRDAEFEQLVQSRKDDRVC